MHLSSQARDTEQCKTRMKFSFTNPLVNCKLEHDLHYVNSKKKKQRFVQVMLFSVILRG